MDDTATAEKKKTGRPRSTRNDASIKFDKILAAQAKQVAFSRGMTVVDYLVEITRATIRRDYAATLRELEKPE